MEHSQIKTAPQRNISPHILTSYIPNKSQRRENHAASAHYGLFFPLAYL